MLQIFQDLKDSYKIEIDRLQEIEIGYEELGNKVTDTYNQTSAAIRELQRLFLFDKDNYKLIGHYELCFQEYFKGVSQIIKVH